HGLFPRPLDPRRGGGTPEPAPVIVQQYVPSDHELRVFVVGEQLIAYRVDKLDPAQLGVDPEGVDVRRGGMAPGLGDTLLALARFWRIDVVAFDLLVTDGVPVFLEANINCDWRWFEHRSGEPAVSRAVAAWVTSRFEELLGSVARPGGLSG